MPRRASTVDDAQNAPATAWPTRRAAVLALGAFVLPLRAQQARPIIGFLGGSAPKPAVVAWFLEGLAESGYRDGVNVDIQYRWADSRNERLPELAAELVRAGAVVLVTIGGTPAARAAKDASPRVPVVFEVGIDPQGTALVESLHRPGGHATGVFIRTGELNAKRLQLLHQMVPRARSIAILATTVTAPNIEADVRAASAALRVETTIVRADSEAEIDSAFASLRDRQAGGLVVGNSPFFDSRRDQLVALAARHAVPAIYEWSDFATAGGLMSYGTDRVAAFRALGRYTARVLKGASTAELPVLQSERFEFVINRRTAAALGLAIPRALLQSADKVIE